MLISKLYFDIIERRRSKIYYFLFVTVAILFSAIIISSLFDEGKEPPFVRTLIITVGFLVVFFVTLVRSFTVKEFKKLGQIHFTENGIKIVKLSETLIYSLNGIDNFQIEINDTADDSAGMKRMYNLEGINNYVKFTDASGEQHQYRIYLEGIASLRLLDKFLKNWKYKNYSMTGSRSITNY